MCLILDAIMAKIIKIDDCDQCPYNDHMGGFAKIKFVPICRKADRSQPYEVINDQRFGINTAHRTTKIPD